MRKLVLAKAPMRTKKGLHVNRRFRLEVSNDPHTRRIFNFRNHVRPFLQPPSEHVGRNEFELAEVDATSLRKLVNEFVRFGNGVLFVGRLGLNFRLKIKIEYK